LYFAVRDRDAEIRAVQPFFILDQDILAGVRAYCGGLIDAIRRHWPRFMVIKTMMIGCVAGEAHLDDGNDATRAATAEALAAGIVRHARALRVRLIVLKEFPASYRDVLSCFVRSGFTRVPEHAVGQAQDRLCELRRIHAEGAQQRYQSEAAQEILRGRARRADRAQRVERRRSGDR
jgi:hypothetical protein